MAPTELERFKTFLEESFSDGVSYRELRLSDEEVDYLLKRYPNASILKSPALESQDDKAWYEINLLPAPDVDSKFEDIQRENQRLKQELDALKKALVTQG
ncbi:hypothetical protein [Neobacillus niacini]|uniref:hypothetical protein n=1 Tax=Neobacillus niacini TaxID=86668 RepID=UPI0028544974|nr:hypothetical protein [Neobacillus niacini]MDR7002544.1 hypothetical protein [Neobacillus niacini]